MSETVSQIIVYHEDDNAIRTTRELFTTPEAHAAWLFIENLFTQIGESETVCLRKSGE